MKKIETVERGLGWPENKGYVHTIIIIDDEGFPESSTKLIDPSDFKKLLKEEGWFRGTRKLWDKSDWDYVFRVS